MMHKKLQRNTNQNKHSAESLTHNSSFIVTKRSRKSLREDGDDITGFKDPTRIFQVWGQAHDALRTTRWSILYIRLKTKMPIHVKYIHELCGLLHHFLLYFIVIMILDMFYNILGEFSKDPFYFGFNFVAQESLVLHTFSFKKSFGRQTGPIFLVHHFFKESSHIRRRSQRGTPREWKGHAPRDPHFSHVVGPMFRIVCPFTSFFDSTYASWLYTSPLGNS
jgi:hypothetical protein